MTPISTALQQTLTTTLGAERAAALTGAATDETGAQTAEYSDDVSQHPVSGCGHERAPPVLVTPRGRGHHA